MCPRLRPKTSRAAGRAPLTGRDGARKWQESRGRRWSEAHWEQASLEATRAGLLISGDEPLRERLLGTLSSRRIELVWSHEDHVFAGLHWRAHLSLPQRLLKLYEGGVQELAQRLPEGFAMAADLVLAHEVFHLLRPDCPSAIQEMAAHCFAQQLTGLPVFPGLLDLPTP